MKILGIVTARGGSKRVPRKNVKDFLGKPLLAWTAESGLRSGAFDRFVLSTDDEEIAQIGKAADLEVPFMRPPELASDTAGSYGVVRHVVEWLREHENYEASWVVLLEPSSPGRRPFHIAEVAELISQSDVYFDSLLGIAKMPGHFSHLKEMKRDEKGIVTRIGDGAIVRNLIHRNQDIPVTFYFNSAIYAFKTSNLFDGNNSLWGNSSYGYLMDEKYSMDIDTPEDWLMAEVKMRALLKEELEK